MGERVQMSTFRLIKQILPTASVLTVVSAAFSASQSSASININPLGDSITFGVNDVEPEIGGYRFFYEDLAASNPSFDLNFVGGLTDGSGSDHWGVPASQAQNDRDLSNDVPGMLRAVHNITDATIQSSSPELAAFDPANGKLDAMFIHAGTNSVPSRTPNGAGFGLNSAFDSMKNLLLAGTGTGPDEVSASVSGASFPTINNAEGVHAQLSKSSVANSQSHVFVAGIIPAFSFPDQGGSILNIYNGTAEYNSQVKNLLETDDRLNGTSGSSITYHYVDMFSITVDELDLVWLAGLFTDEDDNVTQSDIDALVALISPELDAGTDYVDWGLGFDESNFDEGAFDELDAESSYTGFNEDLIGPFPGFPDEGVHPTDLGYAIMANVWYNASVGVLVPEPSSVILLVAGSSLLIARRRRSSID